MSKFPESHAQETFDDDSESSFTGTIASFTTERVISSIIEDNEENLNPNDQSIMESSDEKSPGFVIFFKISLICK